MSNESIPLTGKQRWAMIGTGCAVILGLVGSGVYHIVNQTNIDNYNAASH
jgi:TM2 domain-containing membrane protein YozV